MAEQLGFYSQENIKFAILEPADPSDVTEIVGLGTVDFGVKAMIHTVAAKAKGYPVTSMGTLLDEPRIPQSTSKYHHVSSKVAILGERGRVGKGALATCPPMYDLHCNVISQSVNVTITLMPKKVLAIHQ